MRYCATKHKEHIIRYIFASHFVKDKKILDLRCRCGYGSDLLAKHHATEVIGLDNSEEAIEYFKQHHNCENLEFEVGDAPELRFESAQFDIVVLFELIE